MGAGGFDRGTFLAVFGKDRFQELNLLVRLVESGYILRIDDICSSQPFKSSEKLFEF